MAQIFLNEFANPSAAFRPAYFWFLNHNLNIGEMKRQLQEMKSVGSGGVFLHAREGRIIPYLGEDWMRIHAEIIRYGKELGMKMYLYDEDGFPSGYAGGKTLEGHKKEFAANFIILHEEYEVESGESISIEVPNPQNNSELYGIVAVPVRDGELNYELLEFPKDCIIIDHSQNLPTVDWAAPNDGRLWLVLVFIHEWNLSAANVLSKTAMGRFIQLTHQAYYDYLKEQGLGAEFGQTIPGIFTDEPAIMYCNGDKSFRRIIPYTLELETAFQQLTGSPLLTNLPNLFFEMQSGDPTIRLQFWNLVSDLYSSAFFKQIGDWCQDHQIALTGHMANEGNLFNQIRDQVDFFKNGQYFGYGPMDQLGDVYRAEFEKNYPLHLVDNMVSPRFAGSVARLYNKPRTLSECFGSTSWEMSLEIQKTLIDWQVAHGGVNLFTPHDHSYSIEGRRKRDHPPAFNHYSCYPKMHVLNDYIGRLCYLFSLPRGSELPRVGVIYGNQTVLASMNPGMGQNAYEAHDTLPYLVDLLQRFHVDFDILPEQYISTLQVSNGLLSDGVNRYDLIISPSLEVFWDSTFQKLIEFYEMGGAILFIRKLPSFALQRHLIDPKVPPNSSTVDYCARLKSLVEQSQTNSLDQGSMQLLAAPELPVFKNQIGNLLLSHIDKFHQKEHAVLAVGGKHNGDIIIRRHDVRQPISGTVFFLANVSDLQYFNQKVSIALNSELISSEIQFLHLNLLNGEVKIMSLESYSRKSPSFLEFMLNFDSHQSYCFLVMDSKYSQHKDLLSFMNEEIPVIIDQNEIIQNRKLMYEIDPEKWSISMVSPNILNIDTWQTSFTVEEMPGERRSYLKASIIQEFTFEVEEMFESLTLILDSLETASLTQISLKLNGNELKPLKSGKILDFHMYETQNIAKWLKTGVNTISVINFGGLASKLTPLSEPIRLYGNFCALKNDKSKIWVLKKEKDLIGLKNPDLRLSGYPHYIYPITYTFNFELPDNFDTIVDQIYLLQIPKENAPLCEVRINGAEPLLVWSGSYSARLKHLQSGSNSVKVTMYPYSINLFESPGKPLGFQSNFQIYSAFTNLRLI